MKEENGLYRELSSDLKNALLDNDDYKGHCVVNSACFLTSPRSINKLMLMIRQAQIKHPEVRRNRGWYTVHRNLDTIKKKNQENRYREKSNLPLLEITCAENGLLKHVCEKPVKPQIAQTTSNPPKIKP